MNDDAIREMAAQLELASSLSTAKVRINQGGAGLHTITGTRAGYLRLAAMFLRAAISSPDASFGIDLSDDEEMYGELFAENSAAVLHWAERSEDLAHYSFDKAPRHIADWLYIPISIGVVIGLLILIVVGAITVFKQII